MVDTATYSSQEESPATFRYRANSQQFNSIICSSTNSLGKIYQKLNVNNAECHKGKYYILNHN